ncbi:MAG TPA: amidohydrolase family protein [Acidimicrobiales bacterium]|nr:amidohydrolase family protein [Acidimicrobiales bacterium]
MADRGDLREPGLPIKLGPCSNGEYPPRAATPLTREAARRARRWSEERARRLGMSRREFLLSTMGAATGLLALAACSKEESGGRSGGTFEVPEEATTEPDVATTVLGGDGPVIDVQTHFLEYPVGSEAGFGMGFPQANCGEADPAGCFGIDNWIAEVFGRSDTTVAVLSAVPVLGEPDPLSAELMAQARDQLAELCGEGRVLVQGHGVPNVGDPGAALAAMEDEAARHPLVAWKAYTHAGPPWRLDDGDPAGKPVGEAFLSKVEELGVDVVCVHKGLSGGDPFASPADIGPAAAARPHLRFCVYHSGFESNVTEGPYDPAAPNAGVDRLVASLEGAGIGPGANVYAELGSTWRTVMSSPDEAAHLLGKLLVAVGDDRILWGTDSIWYGSPQDQIDAFRSFQISPELQEAHGYPALTDEVRAKILWRNAAALHDLDPATMPCALDPAEVQSARASSPRANRTYGPRTWSAARRLFAAEHPWA